MPTEYEILAPKIGALQMDPKKQNRDFLINPSDVLVIYQIFMDTTALNKTSWAVSSGRKINTHTKRLKCAPCMYPILHGKWLFENVVANAFLDSAVMIEYH
jgi:hypothetical protein